MVEINDFSDGRLEVPWKGKSSPYSAFGKLQRVSHAAIAENKRLREFLAWVKEEQEGWPYLNTIPKGPRHSNQGSGLLKALAMRMTDAQNQSPRCPASGGAAPIRWSLRRLLPCPERPPRDISYFAQTKTSPRCCNRTGLRPLFIIWPPALYC
jgi:hypothetical protein